MSSRKSSVTLGPKSVMALCAAMASATFLLCFVPIQSHEIWLQMAQAREMFEPGPSSFSHTISDTGQISTTWLSDLIFLAVHGVAGPTGLVLMRVLMIMATLAGCVMLTRGRSTALWGVVALAPFALAFAPLFRVDARLFTWLFAIWQVVIVDRAIRNSSGWPLLLLPPLYVLWVNLDDMAAVGWLLLVSYGLGMWLQSAMGRHEGWLEEIDMAHVERKHIAKLVPAVLVSGAAILFNPHGVMAFVEPIKWLQDWTQALGEGQVKKTYELLRDTEFVRLVVFLIVTMIAGVIALGRMNFGTLALLIVTAGLGLWRFSLIVLFAMMTVALIGPALGEAIGRHLRKIAPKQSPQIGQVHTALLVCAVLIASIICLPSNDNATYRFGAGVHPNSLPTAALNHLKTDRPMGEGFHPLHWGGAVLWGLGDEGVSAYVDGRLSLYRRDFFVDKYIPVATASIQEPTWTQVLDEEEITWILLDRSDGLTRLLRDALYRQREASDLTGREWGLIWFDDTAEIFARRSAYTEEQWTEIEVTLRPETEWLANQSDVVLRRNPQWRNQMKTLTEQSPNSILASQLFVLYDERVGNAAQRIESLTQHLKHDLSESARCDTLFALGIALLRDNQPEESIDALAQAIEVRPEDPNLWENIAAAHWMAHNEDETVAAYERLLSLNPSHPVAREALNAHREGTLWDDHPTSQN